MEITLSNIKALANNRYVNSVELELGLKSTYDNIGVYDSFLEELSEKLPNWVVEGKIYEIETKAVAATPHDYYPEKSYYRISVIYSGDLSEECVFRNFTVHYTKNMDFIKIQYHHNQPEYDWDMLKSQIEGIFRRIPR